MVAKNVRMALVLITGVFTLFAQTLFAPAVGAETYTSTGSATFSDSTPSASEVVTISGSASPNAQIVVHLQSQTSSGESFTTLGTAVADANGDYALNVTIPSNLAEGNHTISVLSNYQTLASNTWSNQTSTTSGSGSTNTNTNTNSGVNVGGTSLPVTGSSTFILFSLAGGLLIMGAGALLVTRRNAHQV